jgi:glutathione synthase/RimK-type ligase-like ATP-grasp enzyme
MYLYPYKKGSHSVKALSEALDASIVKLDRSRFKGHRNKTVINWGASSIDNNQVMQSALINHPQAVDTASNKLKFFISLGHADWLVPWTTERSEVETWLNESFTVVARTVLNGHSGQGIHLIEPGNEITNAQLYTKYIKKQHEFRVHTLGLSQGGEPTTIDIQWKRKRNGEEADFKVRSVHTGWVYTRGELDKFQPEFKEELEKVAAMAVSSVGLHFGAVDVIYNKKQNKFYVLEINTAPGIEGTTLQAYVKAFKQIYS